MLVERRGRRRLACYHEAGHCVARWYFGHSIYAVTVLSVQDVRGGKLIEDHAGRLIECEGLVEGYDLANPYVSVVQLRSSGATDPEIIRLFEIDVEVELVGNASGYVAEARYCKGSIAGCALTGGQGDLERTRTLLDRSFETPEERRNASLLGTQRATALLRSERGWRAVTAIAEQLFDHGRLDNDDVERACSAAFNGMEIDRRSWLAIWPPSLQEVRAGLTPTEIFEARGGSACELPATRVKTTAG